jgi:hypothetical protein
MAKISTYTTDTVISASDKLIGTDADSSNATKNFLVSDISAYISSGIATNLAVTNVLNATDTHNQTPSGLDTPLQVTFGIAQGTGTDPVMVDVSGNITFNESGIYLFNGYANFERQGSSGGNAVIAFRALLNGVQAGITKMVELKDVGTSVPYDLTLPINATAGDVLTWEIMRDSSGVDQGGLYAHTLLGGWSNVPSVSVSIYKIGI